MATSLENTNRKYQDIRRDYEKLKARKYKNVTMYTDDYVFIKLSEKYYLEPITIEKICFFRVGFTSATSQEL